MPTLKFDLSTSHKLGDQDLLCAIHLPSSVFRVLKRTRLDTHICAERINALFPSTTSMWVINRITYLYKAAIQGGPKSRSPSFGQNFIRHRRIFTARCLCVARYCYSKSSVRLSVCPSVTLTYRDHISWVGLKVITRLISLVSSLLGALTAAV